MSDFPFTSLDSDTRILLSLAPSPVKYPDPDCAKEKFVLIRNIAKKDLAEKKVNIE